MKQPIRAFSVGLFTSGIIFLIVFIVFGANTKQSDPSDNEMITALEDEGYHVLSDDEYVSFSVENDENDNADKDDQDDNEPENDNENAEENEDNEDKDDDADNDEADNEDSEDSEDNDNEDNDDNDKTETYELTIEEGMASSDISSELADNDIIDDASEFNTFLQEEGFHKYVQLGSYDISDDMDFDEIADTITN